MIKHKALAIAVLVQLLVVIGGCSGTADKVDYNTTVENLLLQDSDIGNATWSEVVNAGNKSLPAVLETVKLHNKSFRVRYRAIRLVRDMAEKRTVDPSAKAIRKLLLDNSQPVWARITAATMLYPFGDSMEVRRAITSLATPQINHPIGNACQAVWETCYFAPNGVDDAVVQKGLSGHDTRMWSAIEIEGERAIPAIFSEVRTKLDDWNVEPASWSIALDMVRSGTADPSAPYIRSVLLNTKETERTRVNAAFMLCLFYMSPKVDEALAQSIKTDPSGEVRKSAKNALKKVRSERSRWKQAGWQE